MTFHKLQFLKDISFFRYIWFLINYFNISVKWMALYFTFSNRTTFITVRSGLFPGHKRKWFCCFAQAVLY